MPRSTVRTCAVIFVCATTFAGCARPAKADKTSASLTKRVSKGKCNDTSGLPASATKNWTTFCKDLGSYLPAKLQTPTFTTGSRQTGEVGWQYTSVASFTNNAGNNQSVTFEYDGEGYLANKPKLTGVNSSLTARLVDKAILTGGWTDAVPSAEEAKLIEEVIRLLSTQRCKQVQTKALRPLNASEATSFADACAMFDALFRQRYSLKLTGYRTKQYVGSGTPTTSIVPQSTTQVSTAYFQDLSVQLILENGRWYLNGVTFERKLFTYKL